MIRVLFICHGNICRSTMAESVLTHLVHQLHLDSQFEIDSAATSREEIGNPPHYGTKNKLYEENIPLVPHRARQMTRDDYIYYDYLIGMDSANIRNMTFRYIIQRFCNHLVWRNLIGQQNATNIGAIELSAPVVDCSGICTVSRPRNRILIQIIFIVI